MRWPTVLRPIFVALAILCFSLWAVPRFYFGRDVASKLGAFGLIFTPAFVGFLIWTFQWIEVTEQYITSNFLGVRRRLDFSTTQITKVLSNGYNLADASGKKLFVSNWMIGSDSFAEYLLQCQQLLSTP